MMPGDGGREEGRQSWSEACESGDDKVLGEAERPQRLSSVLPLPTRPRERKPHTTDMQVHQRTLADMQVHQRRHAGSSDMQVHQRTLAQTRVVESARRRRYTGMRAHETCANSPRIRWQR
jgi:hypothetical protein